MLYLAGVQLGDGHRGAIAGRGARHRRAEYLQAADLRQQRCAKSCWTAVWSICGMRTADTSCDMR